MSHFWRVVNPALSPAQVVYESGDEETTLRVFAKLNADQHALKLHKSEDDGKTWAEVEPRAPAPTPAAEPSLAPSTNETDDATESDGGKKKAKASK